MAEKIQHRAPYVITTYPELRHLAQKFAKQKDMHCLVIFGSPGLGKTETFTEELKDQYTQTIKARLSAYKLYLTLKDHAGALFLFDDTRRILKDGECINLLMSLGEHKKIKKIQWNTSKVEENSEFETESRLCLLINKVNDSSEDLEPLFSRARLVRFQPTKQTVHSYVGKWFPTNARRRKIYQFIEKNLDKVPVPDIRDYLKAESFYDMKWQNYLLDTWNADEYLAAAAQVQQAAQSGEVKTKQEKGELFKQLCGGSVAQYYWLVTNRLDGKP